VILDVSGFLSQSKSRLIVCYENNNKV